MVASVFGTLAAARGLGLRYVDSDLIEWRLSVFGTKGCCEGLPVFGTWSLDCLMASGGLGFLTVGCCEGTRSSVRCPREASLGGGVCGSVGVMGELKAAAREAESRAARCHSPGVAVYRGDFCSEIGVLKGRNSREFFASQFGGVEG